MAVDYFKVIGLVCQVIIMFLFVGSFIVGFLNLKAFNKSNNISTLKHILDEYQSLIKNNTFEQYQDELENWKQKMVDSNLSPHSYYYNHLKNISYIGQFYDYVGVMVKKKIIDFSLLFEVLPFPYIFWNATTDFRESMQEITYADFWSNFSYLHDRYEEERRSRQKPKKKAFLIGK